MTDNRTSLFRENALHKTCRIVCGTIWALAPERIGLLLPLLRLWLRDLRDGGMRVPHAATPPLPGGYVGMVRDLSVSTLVEAYRRGFFTSGHFGPLKWVSPAERCVLDFRDLHIGKDVRRLMRQGRYRVTFDTAFDRVIASCAQRRGRFRRLTWITPRIMRAYADLHDAGHAHSYEVWNANGELVGGGYGVSIGRIFFGESQFYRERNASKIATTMLIWHLARWGYALADAKTTATAMHDLGFKVVSRAAFRRLLSHACAPAARTGRWKSEACTKTVSEWKPAADHADRPPLLDASFPEKTVEAPAAPRSFKSGRMIERLKAIARSPLAWVAVALESASAILT